MCIVSLSGAQKYITRAGRVDIFALEMEIPFY